MAMDFLVGGLPRGGTTITADLFNFHPEAYCLAHESQVLPLCASIGDSGPIAPQHIDTLRVVLWRQNDHVLRVVAGHNSARGVAAYENSVKILGDRAPRPPCRIVFDEPRVNRFTDALVELFKAGLYGRELLTKCMGALRNEIRRDVSARYIGEKSPPNVFAIAKFGLLGARAAVIMKREPFAFMRSMRQVDTGDKQLNEAFRKPIWEMAGLYREYAAAIGGLSPSSRMIVADYAELLAAPDKFARRMFVALGLSPNVNAIAEAASRVTAVSTGRSWEAFSPAERALIWRLTADARAMLGFRDEYFAKMGFNDRALGDYEIEANAVHPLSGFRPTGQNENLWLGEDGWIALETTPDCERVAFTFWANYPRSLLDVGQSAKIEIYTQGARKPIGGCEIAGGEARLATISVELKDVPPIIENSTGAVRVLGIRPSLSYKPICMPASDGLGPDYRRASAMLRPPSFG